MQQYARVLTNDALSVDHMKAKSWGVAVSLDEMIVIWPSGFEQIKLILRHTTNERQRSNFITFYVEMIHVTRETRHGFRFQLNFFFPK